MPAEKFVRLVGGVLQERLGATTGGPGDADRLVALDATGRITSAMLPVGVGGDTNVVTASEALAAGDLVNIHAGGARKADAATAGRQAHGFVLAGVANGAAATIYAEGTLSGLSGLTLGQNVFLSATAGQVTATAPSTSGQVVQSVGVAVSPTAINFNAGQPITLA